MNPDDKTMMRVKLAKDGGDDSGRYQRGKVTWRCGETLGGDKHRRIRHQPYGYSGHQPDESHATANTVNGSPDISTIEGLEHPDHRPRNLGKGELKEYDMWSHFLHKKSGEWYWKVGNCEMWFKNDGTIHLK